MAERDIGVVANLPFLGIGFHPASGIPLLGEAHLMAAGSTGRAFANWGWDKHSSGHSSEPSPANSSDSVQITGAGVDSKRKFSPSGSRTDTDEDRGNGHRHSHSQSLVLSLAAPYGCLLTEEMERNPKRCALISSSPSSSTPSQYPKCQVDDCGTDLRQAKDYHRRHKVCELHSKASQALVHQIMQRFCQQCSRFHSLVLFDEGKRSCRRRLAGHNRRRRKNLTTPAPLPSDTMQGSELLKMVTLLSQIQSASCLENGNKAPLESKDASMMMKMIKQADLNNNSNNKDPFARGSHSPEIQEFPSMQRLKSTSEETCLPSIALSWKENENQGRASQKGQDYQLTATFESPSPFLNSASHEDSEIQVLNLIDRVGSSTLDYTLHSSAKSVTRGIGKTTLPVVGSPGDSWKYESDINAGDLSIEMQAYSRNTDTGFAQSLAMASSYCQARIALKLMDIDPKSLPQSAQSQLLNWIAAVPSAVETYIRPGCVILTAFLCMQAHAFEEICLNLQEYLEKFLKSSPGSVWNNGRIIVQMGTQQVLIVDGSITSSTQLDPKAWPKLKSVHPLAAVAGKEITLTVKGQNLFKGTKIICSHRGKYTLQEAAIEVDERLTDDMKAVCADELRTRNVQFRGGPRDAVGRCFVEVVDELCGDFLPVIVANATICEELQTLEQELDTSRAQAERLDSANPATTTTTTSGYYIPYKGESEAAICFLHELGWVFEKSYNSIDDYHTPSSLSHGCELSRYKRLLSFAVLRDWCAVVKQLLDIVVLACIVDGEESESLLVKVQAMLLDSNLLHQAVGRKCRPMVELLLSYVPPCAHPELIVHVFKPSVVASGLTPLHIAASMPDCQQIVDVLTDEVGLQVWKNGKDSVGQTPEGYARERGYTTYLKLVEMKLESKRAHSVNIRIEDLMKPQGAASSSGLTSSCRSERHMKSSHILCKECSRLKGNISKMKGTIYRPLVLSMVAIATLCVCVTLFLKSPPCIGSIPHPWRWEDIDFGAK